MHSAHLRAFSVRPDLQAAASAVWSERAEEEAWLPHRGAGATDARQLHDVLHKEAAPSSIRFPFPRHAQPTPDLRSNHLVCFTTVSHLNLDSILPPKRKVTLPGVEASSASRSKILNRRGLQPASIMSSTSDRDATKFGMDVPKDNADMIRAAGERSQSKRNKEADEVYESSPAR